ncbi:MAG: GAF domain-containing protein [Acidobacteriota bacterium]
MPAPEHLKIFETAAEVLNSPAEVPEMLRAISNAIARGMSIKGCQFFLLSRDQRVLEPIASSGLSEAFANQESVEMNRMLREILQGQPVSVRDCTTDPRIHRSLAYSVEGIRSTLWIPLKSRGQVIGAMQLTTADVHEFSEEEIEVARVVAAVCASLILRSMFQRIVSGVSDTVRHSLDVDEVLKRIVRVITEDLRAKGCLIRLIDPDTNRLELRAAYGLSEAYLQSGPRDAAKATAEVLEGKPVFFLDAGQYLQYAEDARREGIASLLSVPLMIHGKSIGVLRVYTYKPYEFSEEEIHLMKMVAEQCALLIKNAQLYSGMKERYQQLIGDFHEWFDRFYGPGGMR